MAVRVFLLLLLLFLLGGKGSTLPFVNKNDVKNVQPRSLGLIIDTTSSMTADIEQVIEGVKTMIGRNWDHVHSVFPNFIASPFNDPHTGPVTNTSDAQVLVESLQRIRARGGGDCPEKVMTGILSAAKYALPKSLFIVFTDGLIKDKDKEREVIETLREKSIGLMVVMTGCCHLNPCPNELYKRLAKLSHGAFYDVAKTSVHYVMDFIISAIFKDNRRLSEPPQNFNDLLLLITREHHHREHVNLVEATNECKVKKMMRTTAIQRFMIGCSRIVCTPSGGKVVEESCDANPGHQDCRKLHSIWPCTYKGFKRKCVCLKDEEGMLVKIF